MLTLLASLGLVACSRDALPLVGSRAAPLQLAAAPTFGTEDAPLSTEISTKVSGGQVSEVAVVDEEGEPVSGRLRADGSAWVPDAPLAPDTKYRAEVTANGGGQQATEELTFTTMDEPEQHTGVGFYLQEDQEYGVAMPVVVEFRTPVPPEARAGVQRRMFVTTDPPQPGVWHWVDDGRQAFYRAPEHWQPGTTIRARIALKGHPMGEERFGDTDHTVTATIGDRVSIDIDNESKQMTVTGDGVETRTMPVSLGKSSTPSSYGNMVVMSREERSLFDTFATMGAAGYRLEVSYALRLTWQGEYIHAAPWSVGDQGVRNVSHGCVNLSMEDARWLFDMVKIGDPVTVTGTEQALEPGNGWTAWDLSWPEYVAGSALPVHLDGSVNALATAVP